MKTIVVKIRGVDEIMNDFLRNHPKDFPPKTIFMKNFCIFSDVAICDVNYEKISKAIISNHNYRSAKFEISLVGISNADFQQELKNQLLCWDIFAESNVEIEHYVKVIVPLLMPDNLIEVIKKLMIDDIEKRKNHYNNL